MNCIDKLAADRQDFLESLKKNTGINLNIFDDFYPDQAHFIYELLQNAEDTGATEVCFELTPHQCSFEHNGSKHFDCNDIDSITGVNSSSKKDEADKIGKFGIGFKAVFAYTATPTIYSRDFSFRIEDRFLPKPVAARPSLSEKTRFEFPFNNPKKDATTAFSEVKTGLEQLSDTTLLFLNNLRNIKWKIGALQGEVLRTEHSHSHVEILKQSGDDLSSSHWLRFTAPVQHIDKFAAPVAGIQNQRVAVAFELAFNGGHTSFNEKIPLAKQLKIAPAKKGKVSVFFPAEKETSGLRFHVHAPFISELSRASIKSSPENLPLFEQLAELAANSLHLIKTLGLLSGEFLGTLPNNDDQLPNSYALIRTAVLKEMCAEPLVPTHSRLHAPAKRLYQANAALKSLLSNKDLALVTDRIDQPHWAIGAQQKNSNQDRLLTSLVIQDWDTDKLIDFLESKARKEGKIYGDCELNEGVVAWLSTKPAGWFQSLYALLYKHCEEQGLYYDRLSLVQFVPLASRDLGTGVGTFFQNAPFSKSDPYPRVDERILNDGKNELQKKNARLFLEKLGVHEPGERDALVQLLKTKYGLNSRPPNDKQYSADLARMIAFAEKFPTETNIFATHPIFKVTALSSQWEKASNVYLDEPIVATGLNKLYALTDDQKLKRWPLDRWYKYCQIPIEKVIHFATEIGCQSKFDKLQVPVRCNSNPNWDYLENVRGMSSRYGKDTDYALSREALLLLKSAESDAVVLVWSALCKTGSNWQNYATATFQRNRAGGSRSSDSQLVCQLKDLAWVPQTDGSFVKPSEASISKLPKGFAVDAGYKWMEAVGFGTDSRKREAESNERVTQRLHLGFDSEEELQDGKAFAKLPKNERQRFFENLRQTTSEPFELPERAVRNADLRSERLAGQARATPAKSAVIKSRSVQVGAEATKQEAELYLIDQYTNTNGQMICQACRKELPFKLADGSYYFETVEIVYGAAKRFREGYLALCPNHAAAYRYANKQRDAMHNVITAATGSEVELTFGNIETSLYFTETHLADAKACFGAIGDEID